MQPPSPRQALPPISSFDEHIPQALLEMEIPGIASTSSGLPPEAPPGPARELKTPQYSLSDDLMILKAIFNYYGNGFNGKVPWSFWQTFSKVSTNGRSSSSLYHHWNGSMRKKYGHLIADGRLEQCIAWVEQTISSGKKLRNNPFKMAGLPLTHNWSAPRSQIYGPVPMHQIEEVMRCQPRFWDPQ